jgi:hypothetical protein
MNPRIVTMIVGVVTFVLGLMGLLMPQTVMERMIGFDVSPAFPRNGVIGEVRATYGGLFTVLGAVTLLAALDPASHRARITLIGLLWLGICAGRLLGVSLDGNPGPMGFVAAAIELVMGGALLLAALTAPSATATAAPYTPPIPPPPAPSSTTTAG